MERVRSDSTPTAPLCSRFRPRLPAFACMTCVPYGHNACSCMLRPPETIKFSTIAAVTNPKIADCDRLHIPWQGCVRRSSLAKMEIATAGNTQTQHDCGGHKSQNRRLRPPLCPIARLHPAVKLGQNRRLRPPEEEFANLRAPGRNQRVALTEKKRSRKGRAF